MKMFMSNNKLIRSINNLIKFKKNIQYVNDIHQKANLYLFLRFFKKF